MMSRDFGIDLIGDKELHQVLTGLDYKVQQKFLKKVVSDAARQTVVKELKADSPKKTGNLRRSMGVTMGRSKKNAVAFAGPRMGGKWTGYIANVIEFNKGNVRYPGPRGKRPSTPMGVRLHSGRMPTTYKGFVTRAIKSQLRNAENHITSSLRRVMVKEMRKGRKTGLI